MEPTIPTNNNPYKQRICPQCQKAFTPTSPRQKFDTPECRLTWKRGYQKAYQQRKREKVAQVPEPTPENENGLI